MRVAFFVVAVVSFVFCGSRAFAETYQIPDDGSDVVGEFFTVQSEPKDTLNRIAVRYGVGYNEIIRANPNLTRKRLQVGTEVVVPTAYVIPDVEHRGIVINLAAMRLFYFPDESTVMTYPVAIGKRGWSTPRGLTSIVAKKRNPTWTPPRSIIREAARRGRRLRRVYPAGPNNPLGTRALRLGISGYLIHGTNKPWTIGQRRSHGCIRMRRDDVEALFDQVSVGTPVRIVSQRFKLPEFPTGTDVAQHVERDAVVVKEEPTQRKVSAPSNKKVRTVASNNVRRQTNVRTHRVAQTHRAVQTRQVQAYKRVEPAPSFEVYRGDASYGFEQGYHNLTGGDEFTNAGE